MARAAAEEGDGRRCSVDACRACATTRTTHAGAATVALGIGPPDAWANDAAWLAPHVRCFVWFPTLLEPEDYAAALDALPQAVEPYVR